VHAPTEAALHLGRAFELLRAGGADASARVSTGLALAAALNGLDRAREAGEVLEALIQESLGPTENREVARACIEGGWVRFSERGDADGGRELLERGLELARSAADLRLELGAHGYLVRLFDLDGEFAGAIASAERVFELATRLGDDFFRMLGLGSKASALCHAGRVELALDAAWEAARLAEASESEVAIGLAQSFVAKVLVYHGDPEGALRAAARAREAGEHSRQTGALYHAEVWAAEALLLAGEPERAAEHLERMCAINASWPATLRRRAVGLLALGRHAEAAEVARDCLARRPPRLIRARTQIALGLALAGLGDSARALVALREARELCYVLGTRPHVAEAEAAIAEVLAASGDPLSARRHAERAADLYDASGMRLHAAKVRSPVRN
jgi:tetratricopeptide (TPR) repeat protein